MGAPCGKGSGSAAVCGTRARRSSRASQEASAGPGGPRAAPPRTGGVAGVRRRQWVVVRVGLGPGGALGVGVVARGIQWLVRGGWPLVVGGLWGRSARCVPSHTLVLLVHGGLWSGWVGWWAVVVVGVVFVVVAVGRLVVVALVVVGMVLRVWP